MTFARNFVGFLCAIVAGASGAIALVLFITLIAGEMTWQKIAGAAVALSLAGAGVMWAETRPTTTNTEG